MPVILEKDDVKTWLDPTRTEWTKELQHLLKPSDTEFEIYAVSKEVGKVGNNSPNFIIPVASTENKNNIANFFAKGPTGKKDDKKVGKKENVEGADVKKEEDAEQKPVKEENVKSSIKQEASELETVDHEGTEDNAPLPVPKSQEKKGIKRELDDVPDEDIPKKMQKTSKEDVSPTKPVRRGRSATSNKTESPVKAKATGKADGNRRITNFFAK